MNEIKNNSFDWSKYEDGYFGGPNLVQNKKIKGQDNNTICYSREPYAQRMFDELTSKDHQIIKKDLMKGDCILITSIHNVSNGKMTIELSSGLSHVIDLKREKRFIQMYGYETIDEFTNDIEDSLMAQKFVENGIYAYVVDSLPSIRISLWEGHIKKTREEFLDQINSSSKAYVAKVYQTSKGGFFVNVQGIDAFLPGSLAAPNKIQDFNSYLEEEIIVMVEDYLNDMNSFIMSHKKYIKHIMPERIKKLDVETEYEGRITGTSRYGIFVEFEEIFTGLLHHSKMKENTFSEFKQRNFKPDDTINFFIEEITKDNRIILSEESNVQKKKKLEVFREENENKILDGKVASIMPFGIIVDVDEYSGLIPIKEFKIKKVIFKNYVRGDIIKVKLKAIKRNKIVFGLHKDDEIIEE